MLDGRSLRRLQQVGLRGSDFCCDERASSGVEVEAAGGDHAQGTTRVLSLEGLPEGSGAQEVGVGHTGRLARFHAAVRRCMPRRAVLNRVCDQDGDHD